MIRIVKMTFLENKTMEFEKIFNESKALIQAMPGCNSVILLKDISNDKIYFTISKWNSEKDLNFYRNSDLFLIVWKKTKALFADKAQAWSMDEVELPKILENV